jgi:oligopeptide/dipeptide ABC transporter ATP-binding protein
MKKGKPMPAELLAVKELKKYFPVRKGLLLSPRTYVHALDGVSFTVGSKQTIGLVGESGCGKTTLGRVLVNLEKPTAGEIYFKGENISSFKSGQWRDYRKKVQFIFQDPYSSLNPRKTVYEIITTGIRSFGLVKGRKALQEKAAELLELVGLSAQYYHHYPHEFSGGQRQRLSIARALALSPELCICDEPVSALDVSIQAQILNLLNDLKERFNLSLIFISHDLAVVKHVSDMIFVMYRGKIVEKAPAAALFSHTAHPYTKALISAIPLPTIEQQIERIILKGDVTTPVGPLSGCCFRERCYMPEEICKVQDPPAREMGPQHLSHCHFAERI